MIAARHACGSGTDWDKSFTRFVTATDKRCNQRISCQINRAFRSARNNDGIKLFIQSRQHDICYHLYGMVAGNFTLIVAGDCCHLNVQPAIIMKVSASSNPGASGTAACLLIAPFDI